MPSRIPVQDALSIFLAEGEKQSQATKATLKSVESRYYPQAGGVNAVLRFQDTVYDPAYFTFVPGGWDFNECEACNAPVPAMTLCYVTMPDEPYYMLCSSCYHQLVRKKRFWLF